MVIFEQGRPGRHSRHLMGEGSLTSDLEFPPELLRQTPPPLPEVGELQVVRHFTRLSQRNFSVDTHFYPLGSCTMKYNPCLSRRLATLPGFADRHPLTPDDCNQGLLSCLWELQEMIQAITGMKGVSLAPMAGAQGEWAGVLMMRAYHQARGDGERTEILIPDAAHGTNFASAALSGCTVREIPTDASGDVAVEAVRQLAGPKTMGLMLTNPSTLGVYERNVVAICQLVHEAGGLLYYDGANFNFIAGRVLPGEMGFDVVHLNTHKTFATPHGGGGPGAGPVGVGPSLLPFLPTPVVVRDEAGRFRLQDARTRPHTIGPVAAFMGNVGVLLQAYVYLKLLGGEGLARVSAHAALNANYLMTRLQAEGFQVAYPGRRATHEFLITLKPELTAYGVTALEVAKRLLDYGFHAPTIYFPHLVPECLLIEPTETESRETLDRFVEAMARIREEAIHHPELLKAAPHTMPVKRLDEARAARRPDLAWTAARPPDQ